MSDDSRWITEADGVQALTLEDETDNATEEQRRSTEAHRRAIEKAREAS